jgi:hypothetical protein
MALRWRFVALAPVVVALAACSISGGLRAPDSGGLLTYDPGPLCPMAQLIAQVHLDPRANPPTWATGTDGARLTIVWPRGFRLRVVNGIGEVIDPSGTVVLTETRSYLGAVGGGGGDGVFDICEVDGRSYASAP